MDSIARAKLLREIKKHHNVDLHPTVLSMCERAARDIEIKTKAQKNPNAPVDVKFRAGLIGDAAKAIANQNGEIKANLLMLEIVVVFAIIVALLAASGNLHSQEMLSNMMEKFKEASTPENLLKFLP